MKTLLNSIKNAHNDYFIGPKLRNELKDIAYTVYTRENGLTPLVERILIFCELSVNDIKNGNKVVLSQCEELSIFNTIK